MLCNCTSISQTDFILFYSNPIMHRYQSGSICAYVNKQQIIGTQCEFTSKQNEIFISSEMNSFKFSWSKISYSYLMLKSMLEKSSMNQSDLEILDSC